MLVGFFIAINNFEKGFSDYTQIHQYRPVFNIKNIKTYPVFYILLSFDLPTIPANLRQTCDTVAIVNELAETDSRIFCFPLEKNQGPAHARNLGITKARGNYLTFVDADDLWFPQFLERSLQKARTHPFVFSSYQRLDEELKPYLTDFIVPQKVSYTDVLKSNAISCLTAFIDIAQLGKCYMPLIKKRQDMGLWIQYLKKTDFAYGIQEPLAIYRIRRNSLSRNKKNLLKYQWKFYREIAELSTFTSAYYMCCWAYKGYVKYKN